MNIGKIIGTIQEAGISKDDIKSAKGVADKAIAYYGENKDKRAYNRQHKEELNSAKKQRNVFETRGKRAVFVMKVICFAEIIYTIYCCIAGNDGLLRLVGV